MRSKEPRQGIPSTWFWWLLAVTFFFQTAVYAVRPMVSYRAISIGAGTFELGLITAAFAALSLILAVPLGRWIDRWGEPGFIVSGALLIGGVGLGLVWIDTVVSLLISQALLGVGHIACVAASQTLIGNASEPERRDGRYGLLTVVVSLGQLVGPAIAGLVAGAAMSPAGTSGGDADTGPAFSLAAGLGVVACLCAIRAWTCAPRRAPAERGGSGGPALTSTAAVGRVLKIPGMPPAMFASLTVVTSLDILVAYLPAYGEANDLSVTTVGFLLATRAGASMASRLLMLPLISWLGRRRLLLWSMALPGVTLLVVTLTGQVVVLYLAMVIIGFGLGLGQPVTLAWVSGRAPADVRGTAIGLRLSGNRLGQAALPALVGAVGGALGLLAVFWAVAVLLGLSTAAVWRSVFTDTVDEA